MSRLPLVIPVVMAAIAIASQASAHARLETSAPSDHSSVAAPTELDLTFSEGLNLKFSGVKLIGPDKTEMKTGQAMLMDGGKSLMVPLPEKIAPGTYNVEWHALSNDGHRTTGSYSFIVTP